MRLNQLAKKVGRPYTRVEKYLVKELGIEGIEGPNSKVDEEIIEKVIYKFGESDGKEKEPIKKVELKTIEAVAADIRPEETGIEEADLEFKAPTPAEAVKPEIELNDVKILNVTDAPVVEETTEEPVESEIKAETEEVVEEQVIEQEETVEAVEEKITTVETGETTLHLDEEGVIKAPKVELEGIKVMGKIDLPQPKAEVVEEETNEEGEATTEENGEAVAEVKAEPKPSKPKRKKPSPEALEAKRQKRKQAQLQAEREEFEKNNAEQRAKEKEAKRQHYLEQVKANTPVKKKVKKVTVESQDAKKEASDTKAFEQKHKYEGVENLTTWQKIVKWFNT